MLQYKYRSVSQLEFLLSRIVEGCIFNAITSHPKWEFDRRFVGSITKRTVGTLSAAMPKVLAVSHMTSSERQGLAYTSSPAVRAFANQTQRWGAPCVRTPTPPSIARFRKAVSLMGREARIADNSERLSALIDVLRLLAKHEENIRKRAPQP